MIRRGKKKKSRTKRKDDAMTVSVKEASEILNVKPARVRHLCKEGRIAARHNPSSFNIEIQKKSLESYIKKGSKGFGRARKIDEVD
jgi:hypothetical protein